MTDLDPTRIGVVVPYDFALDRELWRWVPDDVTLLVARSPFEPLPADVAQAQVIGSPAVIAETARATITPSPGVLAYACTAGSFVGGAEGERLIREALLDLGTGAAVTTSGALVEALAGVGARRVCVATPYDDAVTALLVSFLGEVGVEVQQVRNLGLTGRIWTVPDEQVADLVRSTWVPGCEAVVVSCTNLRTYDLVVPLEHELGVPVLTANQVTMWAGLRALGRSAVGSGQRLIDEVA